MKGKIAWIVTIIMILNLLPAGVLKAVDINKMPAANFYELKGSLNWNNDGSAIVYTRPEDATPAKDEATLRWEMPEIGTYRMSYYTDRSYNDTTTGGLTKITVEAKRGTVRGENGRAVPAITYDIFAKKGDGPEESILPSEYKTFQQYENGQQSGTPIACVINDNGTTGHVDFLSGELTIRMLVNLGSRTVTFSTTGISEGNFTEFELNYNDRNLEYVGILKNVDAKITPTHFDKDATTLDHDEVNGDKTHLELKASTITDDKPIAGSRPGIKVEFTLPKQLNEEKTAFETIKGEGCLATLRLYPKLESSSSGEQTNATVSIPLSGTSEDREIALQNDNFRDQNKDENGAVKKKYAKVKDDKITVYFCADSDIPALDKYIMKWDELKPSMLIGGSISIAGLWNDPQKYYAGKTWNFHDKIIRDDVRQIDANGAVSSGEIVLDTGYTYLEYTVIKADDGVVKVQITPYRYKGENLYYKVKENGTRRNNDNTVNVDLNYPTTIVDTYAYQYEGRSNEKILAPVRGNDDMTYVITVGFSQDDESFKSQRLVYDTTQTLRSPSPAEITQVTKQYVIVPENSTLVQSAGMDIYWTIPGEKELIDTLVASGDGSKLYYEVVIQEKATGKEHILCIVEVKLVERTTQNADGETITETVLNISLSEDEMTAENDPKFRGDIDTVLVVPADSGNPRTLLHLKNVVLRKTGEPGTLQYEYTGKDDYRYKTDYPKKEEFAEVTDENEKITYTVPSKYDLSVRTLLDSSRQGVTLRLDTQSPPTYEITLDAVSKEVPIPDANLAFKKITDTEAGIGDYLLTYNNVDLYDYLYYEVNPRKRQLIMKDGSKDDNQTLDIYTDDNKSESRTYEVYLYQESYFATDDSGQRIIITRKDTPNATIKDNKNLLDDNVSTSDIYDAEQELGLIIDGGNNSQTQSINLTDAKYKPILEALRQGKIVKIKYQAVGDTRNPETDAITNQTQVNLAFHGLDTNESYNVRVRTRVDYYDYNSNTPKVAVSKLSQVRGITSGTAPKPPSDDENRPPAPEDYKAWENGSDSGILRWNDPEFSYQNDLTYEILRVEDEPLTEELLNNGSKYGVEAFKAETGLGDKAFVIIPQETDRKRIEVDGNWYSWEVTDNGLVPNKIYYYYLRTNYKGKYSDWIRQSVTTSNVERPINLKPITSTTESIDVSFWGKISQTGQVPTNYDFEIQVQEENGNWVNASITKLKENQDNVDSGYTYFEYRINGLKPNKRYNIRVRMVDKTKGASNLLYSLYSETAFLRTMYDQDYQDKEDKYEQYLKKFDMEMEKLKKRPYWKISDGTYKYRESYLVADIATTKTYTLVSEPNATEGYYYLPADAIDKANENQVILEAKIGNTTVHIRPNTLTTDNETIKEAINRLNTKYIKDYYIGLRVKNTEYTNQINGTNPVSPRITVELEVVESKYEEWELEERIMTELVDIIAKERARFLNKLKAQIDKTHISDEDLDELIQESVADIEEEHQDLTDEEVDKAISDIQSISVLTKGVLITVTNLGDALVTGYFQNGNLWTEVQSYPTGDGASIEAMSLGNYIFAGQESLLDKIPGLAPYQQFINKYGLGAIFNLENETNVQQPVAKKQVYASTAKVLGAAAEADYSTFLIDKGIKGVTKLTQDNDMRQDELIYIVMQAYEVLRNKTVGNVRITNRQSVTNIGAFQPIYRDYVYAGVQLGIVANPDNKVMPSEKTTQENFIKMLYNMTIK